MTDTSPTAGQPGEPERWRAPSASEQPPFFTTPPAGPVPSPAPAAPVNPYAAPHVGGPSMPNPRFGTPPSAAMPDPRFGTPPSAAMPDPRFGTPPSAAMASYGPPPAGPPVAPAFPPPGAQSASYPPPSYPPPSYAAPTMYGQPGYPPPYNGAPQYAPGPAGQLKSPMGLAIATLILGAVWVFYLVLHALTASSAIKAYNVAALNGLGPDTVHTTYNASQVLLIVIFPLWIVGGLWLQRARSNAALLSPAHVRRASAWAIFAWITPIVDLWFPLQIVNDTWRVTDDHLPGRVFAGRGRITGLWWTLWLAFFLAYTVASPGTTFTDNGGVHYVGASGTTWGISPHLDLIAALLGIAAYAAWVRVVLGISQGQEQLLKTIVPSAWRGGY